MRYIIKKIAVLFLVSLVLFSSIGFAVTSHLCGGSVVLTAVSIVQKDLSCGMKKVNNKCPNKSHLRKICCQNIFDYFHIQDGVEKSTELKTTKTVVLTPFFRKMEINPTSLKNSNHEYYLPPNRVGDIIIENQTFLI